jgi:hypothetical protein
MTDFNLSTLFATAHRNAETFFLKFVASRRIERSLIAHFDQCVRDALRLLESCSKARQRARDARGKDVTSSSAIVSHRIKARLRQRKMSPMKNFCSTDLRADVIIESAR